MRGAPGHLPTPKQSAAKSTLNSRSGDINRLRVSTNYTASAGVEKALLHLDVRKPAKQEFVQARPSEDYQFDGYLIELKEEQHELRHNL